MLLLGSNRCQNLRIKNLAFVISTFKVTLKWRRMAPLSMYFTSFIELSKTPQDTSAPQTPLLEELPGLHDDGILTAKDGGCTAAAALLDQPHGGKAPLRIHAEPLLLPFLPIAAVLPCASRTSVAPAPRPHSRTRLLGTRTVVQEPAQLPSSAADCLM